MSRMDWDKARRQGSTKRYGSETLSPETPEWRKGRGNPATADFDGCVVARPKRRKRTATSELLVCHICGLNVRAEKLDDHRRQEHAAAAATKADKVAKATGKRERRDAPTASRCPLCGAAVSRLDLHMLSHRVARRK